MKHALPAQDESFAVAPIAANLTLSHLAALALVLPGSC